MLAVLALLRRGEGRRAHFVLRELGARGGAAVGGGNGVDAEDAAPRKASDEGVGAPPDAAHVDLAREALRAAAAAALARADAAPQFEPSTPFDAAAAAYAEAVRKALRRAT